MMTNKVSSKRRVSQAGMSLLEIMIVVTIIAAITGLIGQQVMSKYKESQVSNTKTQMHSLMNSLDDYRRLCGAYPTTEQGLNALVEAPTTGRLCKNYPPEPIIKRVPKDAWQNDFVYTSDGNIYEIKSYGADGIEGGAGYNADISSKDL